MAAGVQAERIVTPEARRVRKVWIALALCMGIFVALCALSSTFVYNLLNSLTIPQTAALEPRPGSQLEVHRSNFVAPESVSAKTQLDEGDGVKTGPSGRAFMRLFDDSTVQLYFDTSIRVDRLRTSRFFQHIREVTLFVNSGTLLIATASLGNDGAAKYSIATDDAVIYPNVGSTVRVRVEGEGASRVTQAIVDSGTATMFARGRQIELSPKTLGRVSSGTRFEGPIPAEEDLIRNGALNEPPTNGAETTESGGLGVAAWLPIRVQSTEPVPDPGTTSIVSETVGIPVYAAEFLRGGSDDRYVLVGMRQEIGRPAEFLETIELSANVKVLRQTIRAGGPRGDLFPLTIKVIYRDGEGKEREWKHSFYYLQDGAAPPNATRVPEAVWTSTGRLALKAPQNGQDPAIGQDIVIVDAIEIYGIGRGFQSWITNISLLTR